MNLNKSQKIYLIIFQCFYFTKFLFCSDLSILPIEKILKINPEIEYIKCNDPLPFKYESFKISKFPELQPNEGIFAQKFIVKIPNGQVGLHFGWIKVGQNLIEEFMAPYWSHATQMDILQRNPFHDIAKIKGKVAVISTIFDSCFSHWIYTILGRLALLEINNIEYDWIYVSNDHMFMKETLSLWGIDPKKIIQPFGKNQYIQADELIVPSHVGIRAPLPNQYPLNWIPLERYCKLWNIDPVKIWIGGRVVNPKIDTYIPENISIQNYFLSLTPICAFYFVPEIIDYIKNKFVPLVDHNKFNHCEKVFISRADSGIRKIMNEDEIFKLFEPYGFKRYVLGGMSIIEQVALFNQAKIIVAAHGSSLVNLIFCNPGTKVIEIFQKRSDSSFYYLSQIKNLDYQYIKTDVFENINGNEDTIVDIDIIKNFINLNIKN